MALKQVVLPAPLGPMRPKIWPGSMSKETASSAVRPPKRMVRPSTESSGSANFHRLAPVFQFRGSPPVRDEALRPEDHHHYEGGAEHEHAVLRKASEALGQVADHDGADDGAGEVA